MIICSCLNVFLDHVFETSVSAVLVTVNRPFLYNAVQSRGFQRSPLLTNQEDLQLAHPLLPV